MADPQGFSIALVCEAAADQRTVCTLIDRVLCEHVDWITPEVLGAFRQWRGLSDADKFLKVANVWKQDENKHRKIRALGHFSNEPGAPEARTARQAFLLLSETDPLPDAVAFVVDTDNDLQRRAGCEQARNAEPWKFKIVLGLPHTKRECWILAAQEPANDKETNRLGTLRQELGFDPRLRSHQLTAKHDPDKLSAKRVLKELVGDDEGSWANADLDRLRERGAQNGLADFINEIESRLIPHFTGRKP